MAGREHVLQKGKVHHKWDKRNPLVIEIDPGDLVHCETIDVTTNRIQPDSPASVLARLDFAQLYPVGRPDLRSDRGAGRRARGGDCHVVQGDGEVCITAGISLTRPSVPTS